MEAAHINAATVRNLLMEIQRNHEIIITENDASTGGRILRGWNNFVGELGLFPVDEYRTLDDLLSSPQTKKQYASIVAKLIAGVCCVLNPEYIALGG